MEEMQIVYMDVDELTPYEHNTWAHDREDIEAIKASIQRVGFRDPIGIWREHNIIVEGHGRLLAAKELGIKRLPCIRLDDMTDTQRRLYAIEHNRTAELSKWLPDELNREIEALKLEGVEMPELDLDDIGGDIEKMPEIQDDDFDVTMPEETTAQRGQVWQLGRHRLMCGDSSSADDVARLMDGATADLLLTDPPYNVDVGSCERPYSSNNGVSIENDSMPDEQFIAFLAQCLRNANKFLRGGAAWYIFYAGLKHVLFESAINQIADWKIHEQLVWVKTHFVIGRNSDYQWMHELCLYGWKTGEAHYFTDSRKEATVIETGKKLATMSKEELIALCEKLQGVNQSTTVLYAEKPNAADMHPTVKPQTLLAPLIRNSSKPEWKVLDIFGGSGSTLIVCEQMNRQCYTMELDPHYVDVIITRWEAFTGEKAQLIHG